MSYILEALKKSDQQRQQHNGPSLQTIHRPVVNSTDSSFYMVITLLVVLIIIVLIAIAGYLYFNPAGANNGVSTTAAAVLVSRESTQKTVAKETNNKNTFVDSAKAVTMAAVPYNALSAEQRGLIPGMTFSFHVYSKNPIHRTIIINGRRVKQGEWVEKGLLLEEITPKGVLMSWNDQLRFTIDVVESW